MNEQLKEAVSEAIREALGGALDCGRAWSAWGVGTMSEDDFSQVADDAERVAEITDAVLAALAAAGKQQVGELCTHEWRTAGGGSQAHRPLVCSKCNQHRDHMPQQVGEESQDDRFPNGLRDAIAYADEMEEAAAGLYQSVIGCETDGSHTGTQMIELANARAKELFQIARDELAARQPVGKGAVAEVCYDSYGVAKIVWRKECGNGNRPPHGALLYAAPPAQAVHKNQGEE